MAAIDGEHAPNDLRSIPGQAQAIADTRRVTHDARVPFGQAEAGNQR